MDECILNYGNACKEEQLELNKLFLAWKEKENMQVRHTSSRDHIVRHVPSSGMNRIYFPAIHMKACTNMHGAHAISLGHGLEFLCVQVFVPDRSADSASMCMCQ